MSDDDDSIWGAFKIRSQENAQKRAKNRQSSAELLKAKEVPYNVHNNGAHLVIRFGIFWIDFWPGTGLWHARIPVDHHGRGVFNLIAFLDKHLYRQCLPVPISPGAVVPVPDAHGEEPQTSNDNQPPWD